MTKRSISYATMDTVRREPDGSHVGDHMKPVRRQVRCRPAASYRGARRMTAKAAYRFARRLSLS